MRFLNYLLCLPLVFSLRRGVFMKDASDINTAMRNQYYLKKVPYPDLLQKIEHHEISKVYFSPKYDRVISENIETVDDVYADFALTDIIPPVSTNLIETTIKNNAEPIFVKQQDPSPIQIIATDVLNGVNNLFVPFIFISLLLSFVRSLFLSNSSTRNPFSGGMPGLPGSLKINLEKDKELMKKSNITLSSFAGSPEIFEECTEVVSYLRNATIYKNAGAEIPRGILLEGPPGTGKTLLAKAIASEADANFVSISASEFVEVFVGAGASKIRNLFNTARENQPCIIFIDEIDSVGRQRGAGINMANDEREQTLNQLLAEMDGFSDNEGVLIIAATNRKDVLDAALLRPGRFDRIITVALPDKNSRRDILNVHSRNKQFESNINLDLVAELTAGFSGAQIKNLLNEAAIYAARTGKTVISEQDVLNALDKLIVGLIRKTDTRGDEARRRVAIHETGHALLCNEFKEYFELKKVTIQSTYNGAGGYTLLTNIRTLRKAVFTQKIY